VEEGGDALAVAGELTLAGTKRPLAFDVDLGGGRVRATVVVTQSEFGMKPYSTLFGALKVADEVRVELDAAVPQSR
jgi:polyisoprenoid-binding protein YceI